MGPRLALLLALTSALACAEETGDRFGRYREREEQVLFFNNFEEPEYLDPGMLVIATGGLAGLVAPMADIVLLQARHRDSPEVTPLKFRKPSSGVVQSAVIRG